MFSIEAIFGVTVALVIVMLLYVIDDIEYELEMEEMEDEF